jgi:hypothetical protein
MSLISNTINTSSPARSSTVPPTIYEEAGGGGSRRSLLDDPTIGMDNLTAREVSMRDIRFQRVETILREISASNERIGSELISLNSVSVEILSALLVSQSILLDVTDRLADLVSKGSIRSMGPVAHPSMRESSLATSRGEGTIKNVGYGGGKDLLVDAVVVVLEGCLTRVRVDAFEYVSYASEVTAQVKSFLGSLVSIYKMPMPKNEDMSSMDLARTVQEILRRSVSLDTFSILNPANSYAQVMTTIWSILQSMKKIIVLLPLNVRLAL